MWNILLLFFRVCPPCLHATILAAHFSQASKRNQREGFKQDKAFSLPPFCPPFFHPQGAGCDKGRPDADGLVWICITLAQTRGAAEYCRVMEMPRNYTDITHTHSMIYSALLTLGVLQIVMSWRKKCL